VKWYNCPANRHDLAMAVVMFGDRVHVAHPFIAVVQTCVVWYCGQVIPERFACDLAQRKSGKSRSSTSTEPSRRRRGARSSS